MSVELILREKGRDVATIAPEETLAEAVRILSARRIGALVVSTGGPVLGILSERDVVKEVARAGTEALSRPVSAVMTEKVVTCSMKSAIQEVMEVMTSGKFRHLPVVEEGRLEGIVSIGDIVKHRLAQIESESQALKQYIATA